MYILTWKFQVVVTNRHRLMKDHTTIDNIHIDIMITITTTSHTITIIIIINIRNVITTTINITTTSITTTTTTYKYVDKWTASGKKNNKIKKIKEGSLKDSKIIETNTKQKNKELNDNGPI